MKVIERYRFGPIKFFKVFVGFALEKEKIGLIEGYRFLQSAPSLLTSPGAGTNDPVESQ